MIYDLANRLGFGSVRLSVHIKIKPIIRFYVLRNCHRSTEHSHVLNCIKLDLKSILEMQSKLGVMSIVQ